MALKRFYVTAINSNIVELTEDEHNHLKNVMRLSVGSEVIVVCGDEFDYVCEITKINKNSTELKVTKKVPNEHNPKINVTVFQALTKNDNMNLIVQKLTELGVSTFQPFESTFSTAKIKETKVDKWQKISNQSMKQCKRSKCMQIKNPVKFNEILADLHNFDVVIFANECENNFSLNALNNNYNNIAIIVGSEGGFSEQEIETIISHGGVSVRLGNRILRAETASIALTSVVMYKFGEW